MVDLSPSGNQGHRGTIAELPAAPDGDARQTPPRFGANEIADYKRRVWADLQQRAAPSYGTSATGFGTSELAGVIEQYHAAYKAVAEYRDILVEEVKALVAARDQWFIPELARLNDVVAGQAGKRVSLVKKRFRRWSIWPR